jgi:hypothetical protein
MMSLLILKEWWLGFEKRIIVIVFREKYPAAKAPIGSDDIIFVYSMHVECIVLLEKEK